MLLPFDAYAQLPYGKLGSRDLGFRLAGGFNGLTQQKKQVTCFGSLSRGDSPAASPAISQGASADVESTPSEQSRAPQEGAGRCPTCLLVRVTITEPLVCYEYLLTHTVQSPQTSGKHSWNPKNPYV